MDDFFFTLLEMALETLNYSCGDLLERIGFQCVEGVLLVQRTYPQRMSLHKCHKLQASPLNEESKTIATLKKKKKKRPMQYTQN